LKYFAQFDKIIINSGGAPTSLARKIAAAKKEAAKARAGPEGETSFPYGVNKNSCFLLAP